MNSKYVYAFAGLLLGLTACSNEDLLNQTGQHNGETVFVSLSVDRSLQGTRTILSEADADGGVGLSSVWAKGDKVTLVSASGQVAGTLTLEGEGGESEGVFSGELSIADGKYSVWYLGAEPAYAKFEENSLVNALATSGCAVSGDFSDLNKGELMKSEVEIIVRDGKASVAENVTLAPQMAMAHFTLAMDGLETALAADGSKLTLSYSVGETPYSYTITNKKADVYVPLFPGEYAPSFTLVSEGKTYTYAFANETIVEAGLYYTGDKNSTTGESEGIKVTLKDPDENDPYEGYENEDKRNPLHKFAKYNLVRVGERGSLDNGFADSETENGALYQWGRNYGYMDDKGIFYQIEDEDDFINFEEAMGYIEQPGGDKTQRYLDFYAYHVDGKNALYTCTGGVALDPYSYYSPVILDRPKYYDTLDVLKDNPTKFFMDANYSTNSLIQKISAFYWYDTNTDYWLSSFGDGGNVWKARAKACGYASETPCPDGWRLPSKEEFAAIAPEQNIEDGSKYLSSLLKDYSELRYYNGVDYAIRWVYAVDYLKIQVLVVSSDFKKSQLKDIRWDKEEAVVTRLFPYTGAITTVGGYDGWDNEYVAFPYHRGIPDIGFFNTMQMGPGNNTNRAMGGYWINEKGYYFKFVAGEKISLKQGQLMITEAAPSFGYAIRPVMDIKSDESK